MEKYGEGIPDQKACGLRNSIGQFIYKHRAALLLYRSLALPFKELLYWKWVIHGFTCRRVSLHMRRKATVIIQPYHAKRLRNIAPLVRSALKCDFVEKVIINNNNPQVRIEDWVKVSCDRVALMNQEVNRGAGYSYILAGREDAEFFILIDDDLLIYPGQLALLFQRLVERPEVPHGLVGCDHQGRYVKRQEAEVAGLYNIYAITMEHIQAYLRSVEKIVTQENALRKAIDIWGCDLILSRSGARNPMIHDAGYITQCRTWNAPGVANYLSRDFKQKRIEVGIALERIKEDLSKPPAQV